MNNAQLQRTLRLLRRTGDRGIVLDSESDEVFVLMDADSYEKMLPTSAVQKNDKDGDGFEDYVLDDLLDIEEKRAPSEAEHAEIAKKDIVKTTAGSNFGQTPKQDEVVEVEKNPILSEESLSDVPHDEEEEEKFYLEPVE